MYDKYDKFVISQDFYNGYPLLSKTDISGSKPALYFSVSNRSAGKTTFFNGMLLHNFLKKRKKFLLLYRYKYQYQAAADGFFKNIGVLYFQGLNMSQDTGVKGVFDRLYISDGEKKVECGYATALPAANSLKTYSHLLSDVDVILMDEVFPENDKYLKNEIDLFMSIHDSIARGVNQMSRYVQCILVGNLINIFNPYFDALGVVDSMQLSSHFVRGDGFVIEQSFNETSARKHKENAFHRAFKDAAYTAASEEMRYINTNYDMIDQSVCDRGRYMFTIRYAGTAYSVRYNYEGCFYYVSNTPDPQFRLQHAATEADITEDAIYNPLSSFRKLLKENYRRNCVKFKNLKCKAAALHFISGS